MRRRSTILKLEKAKFDKIKQLETEIIELRKEGILLCDKTQHFIEQEEEVLICGRPKKYETQLIGKIHFKDSVIDEDTGDVFWFDRSTIVRRNGEWL